jgi:outer membrane protein assembly complex protein YaeT
MQAMPRFWPTVFVWAAVLAGLLLCRPSAPAQAPAPAARAIVSDILIEGNRLIPSEQIKVHLKTRIGSEYNPAVVEEDVRTLYATRQFANIVADKVDDGPGKVKVLFRFRDYPQTVEKVTYLGAKHLKEDELKELSMVREGTPLNPTTNHNACQRIVQRYNEQGRLFASCTLLKGADPADKEVIFNISEGDKVVVRNIRFVGNTFVSGGVLATHIATSRQWFHLIGGVYNPGMVENDVNELIKYYRSFGFHDVKVSREIQWADHAAIVLVFHIEEGLRYQVTDVPQVIGARTVPHEQLEALSQVKKMGYYDDKTIQGDVQRIKDWYGYNGEDVQVNPNSVWSKDTPGLCTVQYQIEEQPVARVGQIFIVGNERTRQNVILRQIPLYPGQILTYPDLRVAERNLTRLNIFAATPDGATHPTVTVLNPESDSVFKDILVTVQEDNTGSLLFGLGVNSDSGLTGSIVLNERNFDIFRPPTSIDDLLSGNAWRGAGQEFRIEAVPGTSLQRYTVSFREPFLFDSPYSLQLSGYYYERIFNEYNEEREGARATIGRRLNQYWQASIGGRIENVNVSNVSVFAPVDYQSVVGDNFQVGVNVGLTRDSRDSFLRPTSGSVINFTAEEMTGDHTFTLASIDASKYFTVWQRNDGSGRHVLALHTQFGWASAATPVYERYFAGGFRTLRGFAFRGVGPDVNGFKVGGDFLWLNSAEYQIPVKANDQIYFVTFVDSGTVETNIGHLTDYRVSAGFGVRFVVPMLGQVPIALDFGFPIVKGPNDQTQVFNFWMGFFR